MKLFHALAEFIFVLTGKYLLVRKLPIFDWQQSTMHMWNQLIQMYNECGNILFTISAADK